MVSEQTKVAFVKRKAGKMGEGWTVCLGALGSGRRIWKSSKKVKDLESRKFVLKELKSWMAENGWFFKCCLFCKNENECEDCEDYPRKWQSLVR